MDIANQIRFDRMEKRLSAVTVSMITVQAMTWGIVAAMGEMNDAVAEAAQDALDAWGELLTEAETDQLKPVMDKMAELLRERRV